MAADQVKENPEAKAADSSASDAQPDAPATAEKEAADAGEKMSQEVNNSVASTTDDQTDSTQNKTNDAGDTTASSQDAGDQVDVADDGVELSPWQKELAEEREDLRRKFENGELDANGLERRNQLEAGFKSIAEARAKGASEAQIRAQFGNLILQDGVKSIELDGNNSGRDISKVGNFSLTMDGRELVNFNDANWGFGKDNSANAVIDVNLPDDARTVENPHGKMSVVEGADGTNARIIEKDGMVLVNRGDEYVAMQTGNLGFGQQVLEGEEAKKLFEAEEKNFEGVETASSNGHILINNNGVNLVDITMGNVAVNTPEDAQVTAQNSNGNYMQFANGTQMIKGADNTAMIRKANGDVIQVAANGQITEMDGSEASTAEAWNNQFEKFETDVKVAGADDTSLWNSRLWQPANLGSFGSGPLADYNLAFASDVSFYDPSLFSSGADLSLGDPMDPSADLNASTDTDFSFAKFGKSLWDGTVDAWNSDKNPLNFKWTDDLFSDVSFDMDWSGAFKEAEGERTLNCFKRLEHKTGHSAEELRSLATGDLIEGGETRKLGDSSLQVDGKKAEFDGAEGSVRVLDDGTRLAYNKAEGVTIVQVPKPGEDGKFETFKIYDGEDGKVDKVSVMTDNEVIETINGNFDGFSHLTQATSREEFTLEGAKDLHDRSENSVVAWDDGSVSMKTKSGDIVKVDSEGVMTRFKPDGTVLRRVPHSQAAFAGQNHGRGQWELSENGVDFSPISREQAMEHVPADERRQAMALSRLATTIKAQNTFGPFLPGQGPVTDGPDTADLSQWRLRLHQGRIVAGQTTVDGKTTTEASAGPDGPSISDGKRVTRWNDETNHFEERRTDAHPDSEPISTWDPDKLEYNDSVFKVSSNGEDPTAGITYKPDGLLFSTNNDIFWDQNGNGDFFDDGPLYDYNESTGTGTWGDSASSWATSSYDGYNPYGMSEAEISEKAEVRAKAADVAGRSGYTISLVNCAQGTGAASQIMSCEGPIEGGLAEAQALLGRDPSNPQALAAIANFAAARSIFQQTRAIYQMFNTRVGTTTDTTFESAIKRSQSSIANEESQIATVQGQKGLKTDLTRKYGLTPQDDDTTLVG